jgi:hypothetical protein
LSNPPEIQALRFGRIVIDGVVYNRDVIIFPDRVRSNWRRRDGHNLAIKDLVEVLEGNPEVIILGRGVSGGLSLLYYGLKGLGRRTTNCVSDDEWSLRSTSVVDQTLIFFSYSV